MATATNQPDDFSKKSSACVAVRFGAGWPFVQATQPSSRLPLLIAFHQSNAAPLAHPSCDLAAPKPPVSAATHLQEPPPIAASPAALHCIVGARSGSTSVLLHCSHGHGHTKHKKASTPHDDVSGEASLQPRRRSITALAALHCSCGEAPLQPRRSSIAAAAELQ